MDRDLLLMVMLALSVVGLVVAGYQTYEHYYLSSSICDVSTELSCSVVTESRFGEFPAYSGIATSLYGMVWWAVLIVLLAAQRWERSWIAGITQGTVDTLRLDFFGLDDLDFATFGWMIAGLGTVFYLLWAELIVLPAETGQVVICPFCTVQHILIVVLLIATFFILEKPVTAYLEDIFYTEG